MPETDQMSYVWSGTPSFSIMPSRSRSNWSMYAMAAYTAGHAAAANAASPVATASRYTWSTNLGLRSFHRVASWSKYAFSSNHGSLSPTSCGTAPSTLRRAVLPSMVLRRRGSWRRTARAKSRCRLSSSSGKRASSANEE